MRNHHVKPPSGDHLPIQGANPDAPLFARETSPRIAPEQRVPPRFASAVGLEQIGFSALVRGKVGDGREGEKSAIGVEFKAGRAGRYRKSKDCLGAITRGPE